MPALPSFKLTSAPAPSASSSARDCFHCGQRLPAHSKFTATIDGEQRPMCCQSDAAVAAAADLILLSDKLADLGAAWHTAALTLRVIRQNIARAAVYNAVALPAAALGYVAPWLAAIGMSASSLTMVVNAPRRLVGRRRPPGA